MAEARRRINIIIHPDGTITAGTEGLHGKDCLPYLGLVCKALDAVPNVSIEQAHSILSDDYYDHLPQEQQQEEGWQRRKQNYVYE